MEMHAGIIAWAIVSAGLYPMTSLLAPRLHAWNRDARWAKLSWYVQPEEGSIRAWIERDRPRLQRLGAWLVTKFFLYGLRKLLIAPFVVILVSEFVQIPV